MDVVYEAEDLKLQRHVAPAFERFRFDLGRTRHGLFERFGWGSEDKELGGSGSRTPECWAGRSAIPPPSSTSGMSGRTWTKRVIAQNRALLDETRRTGATWTPAGISHR